MRDDEVWTKVVAGEIERNKNNNGTFEVALLFYLITHCLSTLENPTHTACIHSFGHLTIVHCTLNYVPDAEQGSKDTLKNKRQPSFQQIILLSHQDQTTSS